MRTFIDFLYYLDQHGISYHLSQARKDCILIDITLDTERWAIEFSVDGDIFVKRFGAIGEVEGEEIVKYLFANHLVV